MIERARRWVLARFGRNRLLSLALLLLLFGSLIYGVSSTVRGIERELLWPLVWAGLLVGWLLAYRRVRGWLAALAGPISGIVLLLLVVGRLGDPVLALLGETASQVLQVMQGVFWPAAAPIQAAWSALLTDLSTLGVRLTSWSLNLVQGQPIYDPLPVALLWGLAVWCTAIWAGWAVRRRVEAVWTVAPAASLLAATLAYAGGRAWYLLPVLASVLLLEALSRLESRTQRWQQDSVQYSRRIRSDTIWLALGLSLVLVLAAAITPSISVAGIVELARDLTQAQPTEEVARSLGIDPQISPATSEMTTLDLKRSIGLPTSHLIGAGPELSDQVALVVSIEAAQSGATASLREQTAPYYWRGLTYERYSGRGWSAEYAGRVRYDAGEAAIDASSAHGGWLRADVRRMGNKDQLMYVAGTVITADHEFRVAWRSQPGEEGPSGDLYGALIGAGTYRVDSLVPVLSEEDLRAAGQDYPDWILDRYLALPEGVPDRVLALARDLTAIQLTPYDRAIAIEAYLRRFPYTLDVPLPPPDRDVVDYFLFDLQQGYCDYYATAMVVLARAAGLPARLVTGYASGTYDAEHARYVVTQAEAHAWAEIYFPGYGWSEFEPTAGLPAIERPEEALPEIRAELETPSEPITARRSRARWVLWLGILGALVALALAGAVSWRLADGWRLRHLPPKDAAIQLYRRLYRYGPWLKVSPRQGATPREFAASLGWQLGKLAVDRRWGSWVDAAPGEMCWLADLCTRALYGLHRLRESEKEEAIQTWSSLRRRLWLARLLTVAPW